MLDFFPLVLASLVTLDPISSKFRATNPVTNIAASPPGRPTNLRYADHKTISMNISTAQHLSNSEIY